MAGFARYATAIMDQLVRRRRLVVDLFLRSPGRSDILIAAGLHPQDAKAIEDHLLMSPCVSPALMNWVQNLIAKGNSK